MFESLDTLCNGINIFTNDCIKDITINESQCEENIQRSIGIVTALCPYIGYTKAAKLAKKALYENKNIRDVVEQEKLIPPDKIDSILNPVNMI